MACLCLYARTMEEIKKKKKMALPEDRGPLEKSETTSITTKESD